LIIGITLLKHRKDGDGFFGSLVLSCGDVTSPATPFQRWPMITSISTARNDLPVARTQPGEDGLSGRGFLQRSTGVTGGQSASQRCTNSISNTTATTCADGEGIRAEPPRPNTPALSSPRTHLASQRHITRWAVSITACHGRWRAPPGPWFTTGAYPKPAEASRLSPRAYAPRFRR
jgi:hypothetical protein